MRPRVVLRSPVGVHDRVAGDQAGLVRRGDRLDGQARAHVRRDDGRGEVASDQVWHRRRALVRLRQIPAPTPGDALNAVLAHEPSDTAPPDIDALVLEFTGNALSAVLGMSRVDLDDALRQLTIVEISLGPAGFCAGLAVVVAGVGRQNLAHPIRAEPAAASVNEGEALASRGVVDPWFRRLAQDLIFDAESLDRAALLTKLIAHRCRPVPPS